MNNDLPSITLEFLHKYIATLLPDSDLVDAKNLRVQWEDSFELMGKKIAMDWKDLAHKLHEDKETVYFYWKTPSTWWQHFKLEKAPKWFKTRYPVKYNHRSSKRTVTFKRYAVYPMANIAIPKESKLFIEQLGGVERIEDKVT